MESNLDMFKTYDIRIEENLLTNDDHLRLLKAEATYFRETFPKVNKIVLTRDARTRHAFFLEEAVAYFSNLGYRVIYDPEPLSTCRFYFMASKRTDLLGIMYSASHNPANHIGQKIFAPSLKPISYGTGLEKIKELYLQKKETHKFSNKGKKIYFDSLLPFIKETFKSVKNLESLKVKKPFVICNFLNGSGSKEILKGLKLAGVKVNPINFTADGTFPKGQPNPIIKTHINESVKVLNQDKRYEQLFIYDGDADRVETYNKINKLVHTPLNVYCSFPFLNLDLKINQILTDIKCMPKIQKLLRENFSKVNYTQTGHSKIKRQLSKLQDSLAFEDVGHYYFIKKVDDKFISFENTLLVTLISIISYINNPKSYYKINEIQNNIFSEREWGFHYKNTKLLNNTIMKVKEMLETLDFTFNREMSLDALVFDKIEENTYINISFRESGSEKLLLRFSISCDGKNLTKKYKDLINEIAIIDSLNGEYIG